MINITAIIILQFFLFLTLPFHRLRISPLSAGKTRWEPKGKKVPRWPASSTDQALYFLVLRVKTVHLHRVQSDPVKYYYCLRRVDPVKRNANVSSSTFTVTPSIAPPCTWEGGRCNQGQNTDFVTQKNDDKLLSTAGFFLEDSVLRSKIKWL